MAGHRSGLPLRLQQILSGGRSVSPVLKLEAEPVSSPGIKPSVYFDCFLHVKIVSSQLSVAECDRDLKDFTGSSDELVLRFYILNDCEMLKYFFLFLFGAFALLNLLALIVSYE